MVLKIPVFTHDDIDTFYVKEGSGSPLVLVSGLGSAMSWTFQISFFKKRMMVIAPHNRGVGNSSRPNYSYTMKMFVDDIKALLEHLNVKEKIHLCGTSMGGMIAQNFVLKYPEKVKSLMLCATSAKHDSHSLIEAQKLMDNLTLEQKFKTRMISLYSLSFRKKLKKNKEILDKLKNDFIKDPTTLQDYINQNGAIIEHDTTQRLHEIKQPTLILVGDDDRIILGLEHSKFLHEKISNSTLNIIQNTGHGFNAEKPEEVNNLIWGFIQKYLN